MPTLNWVGKDKIVNHDKDVSFRLLKKDASLSFPKNSSSENLIIEGDNLEALKALMPHYVGKVKCIFIDPPYNTGNEGWVYNDKVNAPKIKEWLKKEVKIDDLSRHDKWLCLMYPRLKLLRELLREDGAIFVSIDDNEHCNLLQIMDEIFGEENFVANIIWQHSVQPKGYNDNFSIHHNFIVAYSKSNLFSINSLERTEENNINYSNPDNDPRGEWRTGDVRNALYRPNLIFDITTPSGKKITPPKNGWRWSRETLQQKIKTKEIIFSKDETRIIRKIYLDSVEGRAPETIWFGKDVGTTRSAVQEIKEIFNGEVPFETPKPTKLLKRIIQIATSDDDIILDSFAGSGTTADAVIQLNNENEESTRKFILVELEKDIARNITSERVRRVSKDLNGSFEYATLGETLFTADGNISDEVEYKELANYIFFTETHTILDLKKIGNPMIGEHAEIEFFLLFSEKGKNKLTKGFLKGMKKGGAKKVVYADLCELDEDVLQAYNITFKQIPYEVKVY